MRLPEILAILVGGSSVLFVLLNSRGLMDRFNEEVQNLRGGGPPTPMHPSPADDGRLLRRRARKSQD